MLASTIKAAVAGIAVMATLTTAVPLAEPASMNPMLEARTELEARDGLKFTMNTPHTTNYEGPRTAGWRDLRLLILEEHNKVRRAHGVPDLEWSNRLGHRSQDFTNQCAVGEGWASISPGCGSNTMNAGVVSEDTYEQATKDAIAAWAGEEKDGGLTYNPVQCNGVCGHFTQMVWKDTKKVGCSWNNKKCKDPSGNPLVTFQCYYDPPGNIQNDMDANVLPN